MLQTRRRSLRRSKAQRSRLRGVRSRGRPTNENRPPGLVDYVHPPFLAGELAAKLREHPIVTQFETAAYQPFRVVWQFIFPPLCVSDFGAPLPAWLQQALSRDRGQPSLRRPLSTLPMQLLLRAT